MLWSHYGAKHHGICLGFDLRRSTVETVTYADKRLRQTLSDDKSPDTIPVAIRDEIARTKSSDWQYEQELRVLVDLSDANPEENLYFWPFNEDLRLAEVILGPRCDQKLGDVRSQVTTICRPEYSCHRAVRNRASGPQRCGCVPCSNLGTMPVFSGLCRFRTRTPDVPE